jgi:hypothetical protein
MSKRNFYFETEGVPINSNDDVAKPPASRILPTGMLQGVANPTLCEPISNARQRATTSTYKQNDKVANKNSFNPPIQPPIFYTESIIWIRMEPLASVE